MPIFVTSTTSFTHVAWYKQGLGGPAPMPVFVARPICIAAAGIGLYTFHGRSSTAGIGSHTIHGLLFASKRYRRRVGLGEDNAWLPALLFCTICVDRQRFSLVTVSVASWSSQAQHLMTYDLDVLTLICNMIYTHRKAASTMTIHSKLAAVTAHLLTRRNQHTMLASIMLPTTSQHLAT
jgi:hypothetical protein